MATRRNGLPAFQEQDSDSPSPSDNEDAEGSDELDDNDMDVEATPGRKSPRKDKGKGKSFLQDQQSSKIIVQTAFDAYFTYNKPGRAQTSSNVFSELLLPLSAEEYAEAFARFSTALPVPKIQPALLKDDPLDVFFSRMMCELNEGFNILCYGLGSKRRVLNRFGKERCAKRGNVVVVNGFQPDFALKDLLNSIEESIQRSDAADLPSASIEKQARRIHNFFTSSESKKKIDLYLIIHNIDAPAFRSQKAKSILSLLAHNPHIRITASIDHINAPLLWSASEVFSRKPTPSEVDVQSQSLSEDETSSEISLSRGRGFAWLWHDLTTLQPYDFELAFADRSSLSGAHTGGGARRKADGMGAAAVGATTMSETAATHILASVTQKAQKLFVLLANRQLEVVEGSEESRTAAGAGDNPSNLAMAYDMLFNLARDNFVATNDTALRALLGEFRDHGLIVSAQGGVGGGEVLWIPMRKERLKNVLGTMNQS